MNIFQDKVNSFSNRLSNKWLASWTTWILFFPFALLTTITFEVNKDFDSAVQIYILAIVVHALCGGVLLIANLTIFKNKESQKISLWKILTVFMIFGLIRIISADLITDYLIRENYPLSQRFAAIPFAVLTLIMITLIVESIDRNLDNIRKLNTELRRLQNAQTRSRENLTIFQEDLLRTVTLQLIPTIQQLQSLHLDLTSKPNLNTKDLKNFATTIKQWNELIVRTVSAIKYRKAQDFQTINIQSDDSYSVPIYPRFKNLTKTWNFYPSAIWFPFGVIGFIFGISSNNLSLALQVFILHLVGSLIFILSQIYIRPKLFKFSQRKRLLIIQWVYTLFGLTMEIGMILILPVIELPVVQIWVYLLPLWALLAMFLSGLIYGITGEGGLLQSELKKDIGKARKDVAEIIDSIRNLQKTFIDTVHGKIQSKFTAAALLLETLADSSTNSLISIKDINSLKSQLQTITSSAKNDLDNALQLTKMQPKSIKEIIQSIEENWFQLIKINISMDGDSNNFLSQNDWVRQIFEGVVNDSITNAVRHANALEISISTKLDSEAEFLKIDIVNDGVGPGNLESTKGIGFETLAELGISVNFSQTEDKGTLKVTIPTDIEITSSKILA